MSFSPVAERAEAWGLAPAAPPSSRCRVAALAILVAPALVFGTIGWLLWGPLGLAPAVVALIVGALVLRTATKALELELAPRPAPEGGRVANLVTGLSIDLGIEPPQPVIVEGPGANAVVFWHKGGPALGVTAELAGDYARTELEAVVAHSLARLDPATGLDRNVLRLGGVLGACSTAVDVADDVRAVSITRYPPGLAKAIEKATPATGRFAYLWFVGDHAAHAPSEERLAALQDF